MDLDITVLESTEPNDTVEEVPLEEGDDSSKPNGGIVNGELAEKENQPSVLGQEDDEETAEDWRETV